MLKLVENYHFKHCPLSQGMTREVLGSAGSQPGKSTVNVGCLLHLPCTSAAVSNGIPSQFSIFYILKLIWEALSLQWWEWQQLQCCYLEGFAYERGAYEKPG